MDYNQYISTDPEVLGGKPCITGTRISVELILEQLSLGATISYLLDQYPQLTEEQIYAALAFASGMLQRFRRARPVGSIRSASLRRYLTMRPVRECAR